MKTIAALVLLLPSLISAAEKPQNQCHNPSIWKDMKQLVIDKPEDPVIVRLYALRKGLCDMIDAKLISLDTGIELFEIEREKGIFERYKDENSAKRDLDA